MTLIVGCYRMVMVKGRRSDQRVLARHCALLGFQLPKQPFPSDQHWFRQFFNRRRESSPNLNKPGSQAGPVSRRGLVKPELKLGEGYNA